MKRKQWFEADDCAYFALRIMNTIEALQPEPDSVIGVPAGQLYNLVQKYLDNYTVLTKTRATYVDSTETLQ
jgi:hypothetical protein